MQLSGTPHCHLAVGWQQLPQIGQARATHGTTLSPGPAAGLLKTVTLRWLLLQSSGSVKSLAKSVSQVSLKTSDSKADLGQDQSPRTVTGAPAGALSAVLGRQAGRQARGQAGWLTGTQSKACRKQQAAKALLQLPGHFACGDPQQGQ